MSFLRTLSSGTSTTEAALLKQNGVLRLLGLQRAAVALFKRAMYAGCLSEQQTAEWEQEINRSRLELQDTFLVVMHVPQIKELAQRAEQQFISLVKHRETLARDQERAMTVEDRLRNLVAHFDFQLRQLQARGAIDQRAGAELRNQTQMYFAALRRNLDEPSMRANIKMNLGHELIDDYYNNVNDIISETVARSQRR